MSDIHDTLITIEDEREREDEMNEPLTLVEEIREFCEEKYALFSQAHRFQDDYSSAIRYMASNILKIMHDNEGENDGKRS